MPCLNSESTRRQSPRPSPLTLAWMTNRVDAVRSLLETYPAWEEITVTSGSTLVEAVWHNELKLVKILLQLGTRVDGCPDGNEQSRSVPVGYNRADLYAALLASVHRGHWKALEILLEAGTAPVFPVPPVLADRPCVNLLTVNLPLSLLHHAIGLFRSRDVQVSKRIVGGFGSARRNSLRPSKRSVDRVGRDG